MRFTKMHGIGNDYVCVDGFSDGAAPEKPEEAAQRVADRHFGVGGDGLILVLPPEGNADVRMRIFNADGSEAEMCGNGIRCVAKYAVDHGLSRQRPLRVETGNGVLPIEWTTDGDGRMETATVDMGKPSLDAETIPVAGLSGPVVDQALCSDILRPDDAATDAAQEALDEAGFDGLATCVSMGNPHLVLFVDDPDRLPLNAVGPPLEHAPAFPERINVHFVAKRSAGELVVRTWERGSGATLACGTGACAVCVAGAASGRTERTVHTRLPGGGLTIEWRADHGVSMTGPATEVFRGEWTDRRHG